MRHLNKKIWPFQISLSGADPKTEDWCEDNIGKFGDKWFCYSLHPGAVYAFKSEEDTLIFKIRWEK